MNQGLQARPTRTSRRGFWVLLVSSILPCQVAAQASEIFRPGLGVSIDVTVDASGNLHALDIEILEKPRSLKIRGRVDHAVPGNGQLTVLGLHLTATRKTVLEEDGGELDWSRLRPGAWVEAKVRREEDELRVREISLTSIKPKPNIKGTISRVGVVEGHVTAVYLADLEILIDEETDLTEEDDPIMDDLFGELRSDEVYDEDGGYGLSMGEVFFASGSLRPGARLESGLTLNPGDERGTGETQARLEVLAVVFSNVKIFSQFRVRGTRGLYSSGTFEGTTTQSQWGAQIRQLFLSWRDIGGLPIGITVGKQRIRDRREFLFDEYLDGVRAYWYGLRPFVLEVTAITPIAPLKDRFNTWTDGLIQGRLYVGERWLARAYVLNRWDGDEGRNRNVRYWGTSVDGRSRTTRFWAEGALLRGTDKARVQRGYAADLGFSIQARNSLLRPSLTASVALGSGERPGEGRENHQFRQTGYADNASRVWGVTSLKSYGEVLDPELSNLQVYSVGTGIRPTRSISLDLMFHAYRLAEVSDTFDRSSLRTPDQNLTGNSMNLGQAADVAVGLRSHLINIAYKFGLLRTGEAFLAPGQYASVHRLEVRWGF